MAGIDRFRQLAWNILYDEDFEEIPDPNKPENIPHIKALQRDEREKLKNFIEGSGKVLIDRWKAQIKAEMLSLLTLEASTPLCNCGPCQQIKAIKNKFELLLEAEDILQEPNK